MGVVDDYEEMGEGSDSTAGIPVQEGKNALPFNFGIFCLKFGRNFPKNVFFKTSAVCFCVKLFQLPHFYINKIRESEGMVKLELVFLSRVLKINREIFEKRHFENRWLSRSFHT